MDQAKAKAGSIAAEIQRATLRLERSMMLWGELAADYIGPQSDACQRHIRRAAERVQDATYRASECIREWDGDGEPPYPHVVARALREAGTARERAFPMYAELL